MPRRLRRAARATVDDRPSRRARGERGTAFVAALVVMFTVTGVAAVWLARDVNQRVSDRSALQSVAFQAARAGAQQLEVSDLRTAGADDVVVIDESAARIAATNAALRLASSYDLDVQIVSQDYGGDTATWSITLAVSVDDDNPVDADLTDVVSVTGVAHAEVGG